MAGAIAVPILLGGSAVVAATHEEPEIGAHLQPHGHDEATKDLAKVQADAPAETEAPIAVPQQAVPTVLSFDPSRTFQHGIIRSVYNPEPARLAGTRLDADQQLLIANSRTMPDFVDPFALATDRPSHVETGGQIHQSNLPHGISYSDRNLGLHPKISVGSANAMPAAASRENVGAANKTSQ